MVEEGRDAVLEKALMLEKDALRHIEDGKFTLDDAMMPVA